MNHNSAHLVGWLAADAEVRYAQSGNPWATLRMGVSAERGEKSKGAAAWIDAKVFGGLAEKFKDAKKGDRMWVLGYLVTESWEDKDGQKRSKLVVMADAAGLRDGPASDEERPAKPAAKPKPEPAQESSPVDYGDIPF